MDKRIAGLDGHIILCGAGHSGMAVAEELYKTRTHFVVVERDQEAIDNLLQIGDILYVQGDATEDEMLRLAGIERAKGLITAMGEDRDNVFVTLSARSLNAGLRIVARVIEQTNAPKLRKAGADQIVSPDAIGGLRMASMMIRPSVVTFLDQMLRMKGALSMEEVVVEKGSSLANKTLAEADLGRKTGLLVVAIRPQGGEYRFNPGADTRLSEKDVLIVMGTRDQLSGTRRMQIPDGREV